MFFCFFLHILYDDLISCIYLYLFSMFNFGVKCDERKYLVANFERNQMLAINHVASSYTCSPVQTLTGNCKSYKEVEI